MKKDETLLTTPSFLWMVLFFLVPALLVLACAFKAHDLYGGIKPGWTLKTLAALFTERNAVLAFRTLWLGGAATVLSLAIATPVAYHMATIRESKKQLLMLLIVIPFWTSFLVRIFAWKTLLHPEGFLKGFLVSLGLASPEATLLYNNSAVVLVMVYTYLPFAVLPLYAAASKFDFSLIEAALDLGATKTQAFFKIFIPGIRAGFFNAFVMVFIPAVGAYVIPDLVGVTNSEMIGNKIAQKMLVERNLPESSALSLFLGVLVFIPIVLYERFASKKHALKEVAKGRE